jgi:hypothetical protein
MSIRSTGARKSARISFVVTATAVLLTASGGLAAADPPALNRDDCSAELARAATWPGSASGVRLVSDAFVTHQAQQPPCTDPRT